LQRFKSQIILIIAIIFLSGCTSAIRYSTAHNSGINSVKSQHSEMNIQPDNDEFHEKGIASYYSDNFEGRTTASGEIFSQEELTAAHPSLPFGSRVRVTNLNNNLTVIVTINDRGPFKGNRIIDLSRAAAEKIKMINTGLAEVEITAAK
jgi:rare lipoprotein A